MRCFTSFAVVALILALGGNALADHHEHAAEGVGYFDVQKCTICKPMSDQQEMMHSIKWETHKIEDGMVMVSTMPKELVSKYRECCSEMEAVAKKVMSGQVKDAVCCGFCQDFGKMMGAGAKMQKVKTSTGEILIVTAQNSEAVKMIHEVADRCNDEMKKMMAMSH